MFGRNDKKKVALVSCDVYRPAAIEQLRTVAGQAKADFVPSANCANGTPTGSTAPALIKIRLGGRQ